MELTYPLQGKSFSVTSNFGQRNMGNHKGIDLKAESGTRVVAAASGRVIKADATSDPNGYGGQVLIRHEAKGNTFYTKYGHLRKIDVSKGDLVNKGEVIGESGGGPNDPNKGRSTGPHLHFEVRFYDAPLNPEEIIDFTVKELKKPDLTVNKALFRPGAKPSENFELDPLAVNENDTIVNVQPVLKPVTKPPVKVPSVQVKYYKIKSGDTLTEIAARNNTREPSMTNI